MNCDWFEVEDAPTESGWHVYQCSRCGLRLHPSPHPVQKVRASCREWPRRYEIGHWATLLLGSLGISKSGYVWLKYKLMLSPQCGCQERETALNKAGSRLLIILQKASAFLRRWLYN